MQIEDMTPEQLREYAAEKERARQALTDRYMGREIANAPAASGPAPWDRAVECRGEVFHVDMRRLRSREFIRRSASMQDGEPTLSDKLSLFDYVFEGAVQEQAERLVEREVGYVDYLEVLGIEAEIFELVGAKN